MLDAIVKVLEGHRFARQGTSGLFNCTCLEAKYSRIRRTAVGEHDFHLAQQLRAAGLRMPPKDPREALRARIEGAGVED